MKKKKKFLKKQCLMWIRNSAKTQLESLSSNGEQWWIFPGEVSLPKSFQGHNTIHPGSKKIPEEHITASVSSLDEEQSLWVYNKSKINGVHEGVSQWKACFKGKKIWLVTVLTLAPLGPKI